VPAWSSKTPLTTIDRGFRQPHQGCHSLCHAADRPRHAHVLECADPALAALIAHDRALCAI
jgi:hypothetical protein